MTSQISKRTKSKIRGQGMTEYIIILAMVAIGTLAAVTLFGDHVRNTFGMATDSLAGKSGESTGKGRNTANDSKNMKDFAKK